MEIFYLLIVVLSWFPNPGHEPHVNDLAKDQSCEYRKTEPVKACGFRHILHPEPVLSGLGNTQWP